MYWSSISIDPSIILGGGTWSQIKDKFILANGDTYSNGTTGGNANTTLTLDNLPSHNHIFTPTGTVSSHNHGVGSLATSSGGKHDHYFNYARGKGGTHWMTESVIETVADDYRYSGSSPSLISDSGTHTHSITGNTANFTPTFTGTAGNTSATGSGTSFSNMPPYVVKYCWERVS